MFVTRLGHRVASVPLFHRSFSTATVFVRPLYKNPNLLMQISTQLTPLGVAKRQTHNDHPLLPEPKYISRQMIMEMMGTTERKPTLGNFPKEHVVDALRRISLMPDGFLEKSNFSADDSKSSDLEQDLRLEKENKSILSLLGKNMSAWRQFVMEMMPKLKYMKKVAEKWKELSDDMKDAYEKMAAAFKENVLQEFRGLPEAEQNDILERKVAGRKQILIARKEYWLKTGHPPRPLSGYNEFQRFNFQGNWSHGAAMWNGLNPETKQGYNNIGKKNSQMYKVAVDKWNLEEKERKKMTKDDLKKQKEEQKTKNDKLAKEARRGSENEGVALKEAGKKRRNKNPRRSKKNSDNSPVDTTGVNKKCIENGCSKMDSPMRSASEVGK